MFEDIHALVEFAEAGSIARAASRLHRTPSAITRQMQRLEAELGAQLLDRSVKPPRLTPLGIRIVEQSRDVLKRVDDLKALAAKDAEPSGPFRIGVAHALADGALVEPVQALTKRFPKLRLQLLSDSGSHRQDPGGTTRSRGRAAAGFPMVCLRRSLSTLSPRIAW